MIRFIRKMLGLCIHEWEDTHVADRIGFRGLIGQAYFQRCKKCGARRRVDV